MLISRSDSDTGTMHYIYNSHGDVTAITESLGNVVMRYYYDAFGIILDATGNVDNSYMYSGYQYDAETGFYYLNSRYYDPATERFMSADTYLGSIGSPLSLNLYTYCSNNPVKYWDPSGHAPQLTQWEKDNLTPDQQKDIIAQKINYENATTDQQRKAANNEANRIRQQAGFTGGTDGATYTIIGSNTTYYNTGVTNSLTTSSGTTGTTINNSGTINTLTVQNGSSTSITNSGSIGTVNNYGTIGSINNNGGTIGIISNNGAIANIGNSGGNINYISNSGTIANVKNLSHGSTIKSISNTSSGVIGTITNGWSVGTITNSGKIANVNNNGTIVVISINDNGNISTINNYRTIGSINTGKSTSTVINNTGVINGITAGVSGVVDINNSGTINSIIIGRDEKATHLINVSLTILKSEAKYKRPEGKPNSSEPLYDHSGKKIGTRYYGPDGKATKDVHDTDHGNPKKHPDVPHQHEWGETRYEPGRPVPKKENKSLVEQEMWNQEMESQQDPFLPLPLPLPGSLPIFW